MVAALVVAGVAVVAARGVQDSGRRLEGVIYDPSGATLPGVDVAVDSKIGRLTQKTGRDGRFAFEGIPAGTVLLVAGIPGFRMAQSTLTLKANEDWQRVFTLPVGALSETVTISAARGSGFVGLPPAAAVGGAIEPPRKTRDAPPEYPNHLRARGIEAKVRLEAAIAADGSVPFVRGLDTEVHPDFVKAAAAAVLQWKYEPTRLNGKPVAVSLSVTVNFTLP